LATRGAVVRPSRPSFVIRMRSHIVECGEEAVRKVGRGDNDPANLPRRDVV
jgi:hypothetical protein